jgi:hypothetical protein
MRFSTLTAGVLALAGVLGAEAAQAHPARIVILRHGEKKNGSELCSVGQLRAQALSDQYLGKGAPGNDTMDIHFAHPSAYSAQSTGAD